MDEASVRRLARSAGGILRWPMVPVVLVLGPVSVALAFLPARRV